MFKWLLSRKEEIHFVAQSDQIEHKDEQIQVSADQLNAIVEQLKLATSNLTNLSEQNQLSVANLSKQSEISKSHTHHITEKIHTIETSSIQVAMNAEQMLQDSNQSLEALQHALDRINILEGKIEELQNMHTDLQSQMKRLVDHSASTKKIVQAIGDISNKTKILALNASIEAARAGAHGKGFNVVANEVGTLANLTSNAVVETANNLTLIEQEIENSSRIVLDESTIVNESVSEIKNVLQSFTILRNRVHHIQQSIHDTTDEVHVQKEQMKESANLLKEIAQMVTSNVDLAAKLKDTVDIQHDEVLHVTEMMQSLSKTSSELQQVVQLSTKDSEQYKLDDVATEEMKLHIERLAKNNELVDLQLEVHEQALVDFASSFSTIEAIWSNRKDGTFIFSNPPAGIVNAKVREWFKRAIIGETFTSEIYISAVTKRPCITISTPIKNGEDIIGVIGVDLYIGKNS